MALPLKQGMLSHSHLYHKVTVYVPLSSEPESRPVVDALWELYLLLCLKDLHALALAVPAWTTYGLPLPAARSTLGLHHHDSLSDCYVARPTTGLAFLRPAARFGPSALANATLALPLYLNGLSHPKSTLVTPLTDSLKSRSCLITISSLISSTDCLRWFCPPMPPPNKSSKID